MLGKSRAGKLSFYGQVAVLLLAAWMVLSGLAVAALYRKLSQIALFTGTTVERAQYLGVAEAKDLRAAEERFSAEMALVRSKLADINTKLEVIVQDLERRREP